jgi:hypothetical protein
MHVIVDLKNIKILYTYLYIYQIISRLDFELDWNLIYIY